MPGQIFLKISVASIDGACIGGGISLHYHVILGFVLHLHIFMLLRLIYLHMLGEQFLN